MSAASTVAMESGPEAKPRVGAERRVGQPLLSIAIPTYNRARFLTELLESLLPQFSGVGAGTAELLISDNASEDDTRAVVAEFRARGLPCRYVRNETNIGPDGNFLQCLRMSRGQYVWVIGDDDLLMPNTVSSLLSLLDSTECDLVYLSSFAFAGSAAAATENGRGSRSDALGRFAELVTDGVYFLEKVNALVGLISVMIVNKNLLESVPHAPLDALHDTNLLQVGWLFPLVHRRMRVLYVWERLVGYRSYNSGGWGVCEVFGVRLESIARRYFAEEPELARALMNGVLRYWLCDAIMELRQGRNSGMHAEDFAADIRHVFERNWRYWVFVWPLAELPLPLAKAVYGVLRTVNRLSRIGQGLWRHVFGHGRYLRPGDGAVGGAAAE